MQMKTQTKIIGVSLVRNIVSKLMNRRLVKISQKPLHGC